MAFTSWLADCARIAKVVQAPSNGETAMQRMAKFTKQPVILKLKCGMHQMELNKEALSKMWGTIEAALRGWTINKYRLETQQRGSRTPG